MAAAQSNLGKMYANGESTPEDDVEAFMWLSLSKASGSVMAGKNLEIVRRRMTDEQIAQAQRREAELWQNLPNAQDE